jgi:hypothetical protein
MFAERYRYTCGDACDVIDGGHVYRITADSPPDLITAWEAETGR